MCLILFAWQTHPEIPLIVAANRDEELDRPTAPARFWEDRPGILAGRDLVGGGTWMGVTQGGRFAALTNYRDPSESREGKESRGHLVADYLTGNLSPRSYLEQAADKGDRFPGFNLLVGNREELWYFSNRKEGVSRVTPGIHGLSNAFLDTPWPKVIRGKEGMAACIHQDQPDPSCFFEVLADSEPAPDPELPDTGVGLELERGLSPALIRLPGYGTRASTVLTMGREGKVFFTERTYSGGKAEEVVERFVLEEGK